MKKVLAVIGSKRKLGNGEVLAKEAALAAGCEVELVRLADLKLEPCRGCYRCLATGTCTLKDDLYFLADKIKEADGVIFTAPCYALGAAAVIKLLRDRIIALAQQLEEFWGKPCAVIGTAGIEGWEGTTLADLTTLARVLGLEVKDSHLFLGALPGESLVKGESLERVRMLGKRLFGERREPEEGECPTCWSNLWKFPEPNLASCTFCGQEARLTPQDDSIQWEFSPPARRYEKEDLKQHFHVWLKGKVAEYLSRREELSEIRDKYKGQGVWIKPEQTRD